MRNYPMALTFLLAYLFFNDGIQTVIASASIYGEEELGFEHGVLIATILLVQFVAVRRRAAVRAGWPRRCGAKRVILGRPGGLDGDRDGRAVPARRRTCAVPALGVAIGMVLGGTQALARSYFSLLIPRGKEAEYFSLYHAMDRGTSWFGTLVFGAGLPVHRLLPAGDLRADRVLRRSAGLLLLRVDTERGIREAGNEVPGGRSEPVDRR